MDKSAENATGSAIMAVGDSCAFHGGRTGLAVRNRAYRDAGSRRHPVRRVCDLSPILRCDARRRPVKLRRAGGSRDLREVEQLAVRGVRCRPERKMELRRRRDRRAGCDKPGGQKPGCCPREFTAPHNVSRAIAPEPLVSGYPVAVQDGARQRRFTGQHDGRADLGELVCLARAVTAQHL